MHLHGSCVEIGLNAAALILAVVYKQTHSKLVILDELTGNIWYSHKCTIVKHASHCITHD